MQLNNLCCYYLDCLSHDDVGGVAVPAYPNGGQPGYVELPSLPLLGGDGTNPFDAEAIRQFLVGIQRTHNQHEIFLGYPVRLKLLQRQERLQIEPLFLFPCQNAENGDAVLALDDDLPQINFQALRSLLNTDNLMEDVVQLANELGLGNPAVEQPDLGGLLERLRRIRAGWDWRENIDPSLLSNGIPLANLNRQGIYNRAILVATERSSYTRGLETELNMLKDIDEGRYRETALGAWLNGQFAELPPDGQRPLLEVLPLNSEQRQAVRQALVNHLTVITGPPGTGKSQVVTST